MKKLLFAFLASAFLVGCSDDDKTDDTYGLAYDGIATTSEMRVFTKGGLRLTAEPAVSNFLAKEYVTFEPGSIIWYNSAFREPKEEEYNNTEFSFFDGRILYATEIKEVFNEGDATIIRSVIDNISDSTSIYKTGLLKYNPEIDQYNRYYYQYVAHGDIRTALDLSLLYYKLVRYNDKGERTRLYFGTTHNEFNESFISTLGDRDTLAVKQYV